MYQCTPVKILVLLFTTLIVACAVGSDSFMERDTATVRGAASGVETAIDPDIHPVAIPKGDSGARVIFDGTNYLVVWRGGTTETLYAARVSESGMPLDPVAIRVGTAGQGVADIDVAFNGKEYLVVWTDQFLRIRFSRISMAGDVLDPKSVLVGGTAARTPAVSSDGNNFMLVWTELTQDIDTIYAARVDPGGVVLDPAAVPLAPGADPEIAFDGTNYLIAFRAVPAGVHGLRVAGDATAIGEVFPISGHVTADDREPDIAFAPALNSHLVVWRTGEGVVYGRRVRSDGLVLGTSEVRLSPTDNSWCPHVAWGSAQTGWIVTWNSAEVYAARVDTEGTPAAATQVRLSQPGLGMPAVATSGTGALVVWHEAVESLDILATRISLTGTVLDAQPRLVSTTNNLQTSPAAGFDGSNNLVLWVDERTGGDIRGARVDQAGDVMDVSPIVVANTPERESSPAVVFNGMDYVAVWTRALGAGSEIRGARISPAGVVKDPAGILISPAALQGNPSVAVLASDVLVAWQAQGPESSDILGKRISGEGIVLDAAPIGIGTGPNEQTDPSTSSDAKNYFVIWSEQRTNPDVVGTRISAKGEVLDQPFAEIGAHASLGELQPDIAFDGTRYMAAWTISTRHKIGAKYVSMDAIPLGNEMVISGEYASHPAVTYDGVRFFTAYELSWHGHPADIYGGGEKLTSDETSDNAVAVAPRGPGKVLVAYEKVMHTRELEGARVFYQTITKTVPGAPCTDPYQCATRECQGGICCTGLCFGQCATCQPGSGQCIANDARCTGNCARCIRSGESFECRGDETLCPGECEECTVVGSSYSCVLLVGTVCRASRDECDVPESCPGGVPACPEDRKADNGSPCAGELVCHATGSCHDGVCDLGTALPCEDWDSCTEDSCIEPVGCVHMPIAGCCNDCAEAGPVDSGTADASPEGSPDGALVDAGADEGDGDLEDQGDVVSGTGGSSGAPATESGKAGSTSGSAPVASANAPGEGCACRASNGAAGLAWMGLALPGIVVMRRRRRGLKEGRRATVPCPHDDLDAMGAEAGGRANPLGRAADGY